MSVRKFAAIVFGIIVGVCNAQYVNTCFDFCYALCVGWLMGMGTYYSIDGLFDWWEESKQKKGEQH